MSVEDCLAFVDKLDTLEQMPEVSIYGEFIIIFGCKVKLHAQLTGGPPITINVKNDIYKGFWKDLAREGLGVVRVFEDVKYEFMIFSPYSKGGKNLMLEPIDKK